MITEERVEALERRAERLEQRMLRLEAHVLDGAPRRAATANAAAARGAATAPTPAPAAPSRPPLVRPDRPARELDFEQLVGGRLLAWVGGAAVLAGLALLFALAASRGWIGEGARTAIGFTLSAVLVGLGLRLHGRRRTEAARAALGTGIAGLFMTVTVAAHVYDLVPPTAGLALALAVGALAVVVAVRWASPTIAALGIAGSLLAPLLVGAPSDAITVAFVFVASASAAAVVLRQRWDWLALTSFVLGTPQWLWWLFDHAHLPGALAALIGFGVLSGPRRSAASCACPRSGCERRPRSWSASMRSCSGCPGTSHSTTSPAGRRRSPGSSGWQACTPSPARSSSAARGSRTSSACCS